jgi:hypothetical protein
VEVVEMTHDELLAKINIGAKFHGTAWSVDGLELIKQSQALRAVVELHKPQENWNDLEVCSECSGHQYVWLPCPTIQAIEKELK